MIGKIGSLLIILSTVTVLEEECQGVIITNEVGMIIK